MNSQNLISKPRWQCLLLLAVLAFRFSLLTSHAQPQQKFLPEKFQADLEQFITNEACLTPQEATRFFPVYREMLKKQRSLYNQMKAEGKIKPADENSCKKAVQKRDELELELKSVQQAYHNKFLSILSASKVYDIIKAEDRFHRRMLKNWGGKQQPADKKKEHQSR